MTPDLSGGKSLGCCLLSEFLRNSIPLSRSTKGLELMGFVLIGVLGLNSNTMHSHSPG